MMNKDRRLILASTLSIFIIHAFPAFADPASTMSAFTDWVITLFQAGLALVIIYCAVTAFQGHGFTKIVVVIVAAAAAVNARTLASMIQ